MNMNTDMDVDTDMDMDQDKDTYRDNVYGLGREIFHSNKKVRCKLLQRGARMLFLPGCGAENILAPALALTFKKFRLRSRLWLRLQLCVN